MLAAETLCSVLGCRVSVPGALLTSGVVGLVLPLPLLLCAVCAWPAQALREQDLIAIADAGDPIRYNPGQLVALAHPSTAATAFFLVTAGEVMLLPASLQIPPGTTQLDVSKVGGGGRGPCSCHPGGVVCGRAAGRSCSEQASCAQRLRNCG